MFLRMTGADKTCCNADNIWTRSYASSSVPAMLSDFFASVPDVFPRFENLKRVLTAKLQALSDLRCIVFVQQRVMTHVLAFLLTSDPDLGKQLRPVVLYASGSPATASLKVTTVQVKQRLEAFASGQANLLITTVVAEEGMDVPAANCVIRFDSMVHSVSYVQGRGRARQHNSSFVVLAERSDRTVQHLAEVEQHQLELVRKFVPKQQDEKALQPLRQAQTFRERNALPLLRCDNKSKQKSPLATLQLYKTKTKANLEFNETVEQETNRIKVSLTYTSFLREIEGTGCATKKADAKQQAALDVLQKLRSAMS
eukprot:gb/GEZN01001949.1/.p2 GENE.gb/GEZN01001949.1/~~gb/GEZN01001949.1/.p2  ORF type:complete len:312 (+),score=49.21 gb/GEZN01001949.1/:106-1041(+)